jgi:hypothetical protein
MSENERDSDTEREIERDPELEARFARAPREAQPGRDLWPAIARTIDAEAPVRVRPPARRRFPAVPLRIAAALVLFASGVLVGQRWGDPAPAPEPAPETPVVRAHDPLAAAAEVQRAGTAYVSALSRLDASAGAVERDQGVDAALSALQGAAYELVRLRPDDPQAGRILYTVSEARAGEGGDPPTVRF